MSGTVKPIMVAYLGKDFDFSAAFEELDQNKVSCIRNMDIFICLNKIEVLFFSYFQRGVISWVFMIEMLLSAWTEKEINLMKQGSKEKNLNVQISLSFCLIFRFANKIIPLLHQQIFNTTNLKKGQKMTMVKLGDTGASCGKNKFFSL